MVKAPKSRVVNGQSAEKSWSKFWPAVAAVTIESMEVTPPAIRGSITQSTSISKSWRSCTNHMVLSTLAPPPKYNMQAYTHSAPSFQLTILKLWHYAIVVAIATNHFFTVCLQEAHHPAHEYSWGHSEVVERAMSKKSMGTPLSPSHVHRPVPCWLGNEAIALRPMTRSSSYYACVN